MTRGFLRSKLLVFSIMAVFALALASCNKSSSGDSGSGTNPSINTNSSGATLSSIAVTPASPSIAAGTTQQFTATGTYSDASTQDLSSSATWSSGSTSTATISTSGLASGVAAGTTTITATSGSISGTATLTVTSASLSSISVTPAAPSMAAGSTKQFAAKGTYSDSSTQDLSSSATWSSSSTGTATVSSTGLATGVTAGTATITASSGTTSGTAALTVTSASCGSTTSVSGESVNGTLPSGNISCYSLSPIGGQPTSVNLFAVTGTPSFKTYSDSGFTTAITCDRADNATGVGGNPSDCIINSAPSTVYVKVLGSSGDTFTLLVLQPGEATTAANPSASDGSSGSPSATGITAGNDNSSLQVLGSGGTSYYSITGLTSGSTHTVAIADITNSAAVLSLALYSDSSFTSVITCSTAHTNTTAGTPQDCTFTAPGSGNVYPKVTNSGGATRFTMMMN